MNWFNDSVAFQKNQSPAQMLLTGRLISLQREKVQGIQRPGAFLKRTGPKTAHFII